MKKAKIILTVIIATTFLFNAQAAIDKDGEAELTKNSTTSINGKVIDKLTGEALTGAKVVLEELGVTTYTDFEGNFSVSGIKPGEYKISTTLISYSNMKAHIKTIIAESGNIEIELETVN